MHPIWDQFADGIVPKLLDGDDPSLWQLAIETMISDAEFLCKNARAKSVIFAQVGACSHWLSPHNKGSWFKDVRYAWPAGYEDTGSIVFGLPEFDWSLVWRWDADREQWNLEERIRGKRPLTLRIAVPARTRGRRRIVVHGTWWPSSPCKRQRKGLLGYGFIHGKDGWNFNAIVGFGVPYPARPE